jgi:hypothetical protein
MVLVSGGNKGRALCMAALAKASLNWMAAVVAAEDVESGIDDMLAR